MPSVTLQPLKPKLSNLQAFLKDIEAKKNKGKMLKEGQYRKKKVYKSKYLQYI